MAHRVQPLLPPADGRGGAGGLALLALASIVVGHFWQFSYTDITNNLNDPPSSDQPLRHQFHRQRHARPGHGRGAEGHRDLRCRWPPRDGDRGRVGASPASTEAGSTRCLMRFVDLILVIPGPGRAHRLGQHVAKQSDNWFWLAVIIGRLVDLFARPGARRLPLACASGIRRGVPGPRGTTAHHLAPAAQRRRPIIVNATITVALSICLSRPCRSSDSASSPPTSHSGS